MHCHVLREREMVLSRYLSSPNPYVLCFNMNHPTRSLHLVSLENRTVWKPGKGGEVIDAGFYTTINIGKWIANSLLSPLRHQKSGHRQYPQSHAGCRLEKLQPSPFRLPPWQGNTRGEREASTSCPGDRPWEGVCRMCAWYTCLSDGPGWSVKDSMWMKHQETSTVQLEPEMVSGTECWRAWPSRGTIDYVSIESHGTNVSWNKWVWDNSQVTPFRWFGGRCLAIPATSPIRMRAHLWAYNQDMHRHIWVYMHPEWVNSSRCIPN